MIITIHQPEHLIWLGLIDKISRADIFVVFDIAPFRKNYFQNRNKIKTQNSWTWLTVPIKKHPLKIKITDIEISYNGQDWTEHYLGLIKANYSKAKYFNKYFPELEQIILKKHKYLADLNFELIEFILKHFKVKTKIIKASELKLPEVKGGSEVVLEICKTLSADTYLSGISGKDYLDLSAFKSSGIKVKFQEFDYSDDTVSSIDPLLNYGPKSKNIKKYD
jgi:hypothetical protein